MPAAASNSNSDPTGRTPGYAECFGRSSSDVAPEDQASREAEEEKTSIAKIACAKKSSRSPLRRIQSVENTKHLEQYNRYGCRHDQCGTTFERWRFECCLEPVSASDHEKQNQSIRSSELRKSCPAPSRKQFNLPGRGVRRSCFRSQQHYSPVSNIACWKTSAENWIPSPDRRKDGRNAAETRNFRGPAVVETNPSQANAWLLDEPVIRPASNWQTTIYMISTKLTASPLRYGSGAVWDCAEIFKGLPKGGRVRTAKSAVSVMTRLARAAGSKNSVRGLLLLQGLCCCQFYRKKFWNRKKKIRVTRLIQALLYGQIIPEYSSLGTESLVKNTIFNRQKFPIPLLETVYPSCRNREYQTHSVSHLSRDSPHAMTDIPSGKPIGCSISGRNIPLFPTSIHLYEFLFARQSLSLLLTYSAARGTRKFPLKVQYTGCRQVTKQRRFITALPSSPTVLCLSSCRMSPRCPLNPRGSYHNRKLSLLPAEMNVSLSPSFLCKKKNFTDSRQQCKSRCLAIRIVFCLPGETPQDASRLESHCGKHDQKSNALENVLSAHGDRNEHAE
eukprot:284817544_3